MTSFPFPLTLTVGHRHPKFKSNSKDLYSIKATNKHLSIWKIYQKHRVTRTSVEKTPARYSTRIFLKLIYVYYFIVMLSEIFNIPTWIFNTTDSLRIGGDRQRVPEFISKFSCPEQHTIYWWRLNDWHIFFNSCSNLINTGCLWNYILLACLTAVNA